MITARKLDATEPAATLDAMHMLSDESYRPEWACTNPPHPARAQLDRLLANGERHLFVAEDDGVVVGWIMCDDDGDLYGGMVQHGPQDGHGNQFAPNGIAILTPLVEAVRVDRGDVRHLAFQNDRMRYGFEVQLGVLPTRKPEFSVLAATPPPSAPPA